ncbi:MAG: M48 family metallopeptidase [Candidatus Nomurabacteria bacterium]|jgi:predicted metal-dependent hydrolase|nr:M48 family metallopeptidase [Candidatus Nomurabacteria bacterium]
MIIKDPEFGDITVRKSAKSHAVRFSVAPNGGLRVSAPKLMPNFLIKQLLSGQRQAIKKHLSLATREVRSKQEVEQLRRSAKASLPERIKSLAKQHGFSYSKLRFSTATTRWGSCSNKGTVSLNIAIMNLPEHLQNYVILHELTHTEHMNHSKAFWDRLEQVCPGAKTLKKQIAKHRPTL